MEGPLVQVNYFLFLTTVFLIERYDTTAYSEHREDRELVNSPRL